jgi:uncharacterized membrane protein
MAAQVEKVCGMIWKVDSKKEIEIELNIPILPKRARGVRFPKP